ncbi:MAG: penicillin-binding protein 2 [Chloroflexi bacterium]|nr:MAG: penicillin-binding protein 2 [Chloroflexota bacterium]
MSRMGWERIDEVELEEDEPGVQGRLFFFRILIVAIFGILLYRVYWLQQTRGEELQAQAQENQFAILRSDAPRGVIFDRHGELLAVNLPSFNVTITPAFLPGDENEQLAIYERLSLLTGVPVTNTVQQRALVAAANPELVVSYSRLAEIYGVSAETTLDEAGVVPQLPDSITEIVLENSFAQYIPAVITSNIPITQAYRIEEESIFLPGVRVIPEPLRYYPSAEYIAHIVGFMGPIPNENWITQLDYQRDDRVGWSGIESSMEIELAGKKGERQIEVDWTGRELRQIGLEQEPVAGLNLHLTLDMDLQVLATEILRQALEKREATPSRDPITGQNEILEVRQGAVVALNPQTGEVLAMASLPSFDNNRFQTEVPVDYYLQQARNIYRPLVNHAISSTYPPGSTFKLVPGAAALQEGIVSASRLLRAPGTIEIKNQFAPNDPGRAQTFVCWINAGGGEHGLMNMITGLANSCDIYFYKISGGFDQDNEFVEGLGVNRLANYASQFGFGRIQGIELPLEAKGDLPPDRDWKAQVYGEPWSTGDDYNLGIGQGFLTATPMQVAQMAAVIANGGFLYRPSIIHHMTDEDGNVAFTDEDGNVLGKAFADVNGTAVIQDINGNPLNDPGITAEFDANGNFIYQPEVLNAIDVDREYVEIVAEGMKLVNVFRSEEEFFTGATYVDWPTEIVTAGKTGTAEFCENIAIEKGWCSFDDILNRKVLPTHSWYVGYAPADDPQIVVAAFLYHGGEGSRWAAPVACNVMAAYLGLGQYAEPTVGENGEIILPTGEACNSLSFEPDIPPELLYRGVPLPPPVQNTIP